MARPNLYRRLTASVPLLVTVVVHVVLFAIAGYFVVSEQVLGKKKTFEATSASEPSVAQKNVEHRLQVARKSGGSLSSSPVSAQRIFSTAETALQMPAMPDLPQTGTSALGGMAGFGSGAGITGLGGSGYGTSLSGGSGLGRGFMSMSFLGVTNPRASKVVFIVDISTTLMDIRKGGFRAFEILRHEISRLVSTLPPSARFNIVFFESDQVGLFAKELQPATVAQKTAFFEWIKPINSELNNIGMRSVSPGTPRWRYQPAESLKLNPEYRPSHWTHALHAALELQPDTIFLITGSASAGNLQASETEIARRRRESEKRIADLKRQGYDLAAIEAARNQAMTKLRTDLDAINQKLVAQKKDPFIVRNIRRVLDADFQAALKKAGHSLKLDTTGWTDKEGNPMWMALKVEAGDRVGAEFSDVTSHVSRLQYGLLRERASVNIFLFVDPDEKTEEAEKNLASLASKNGGKFSLLTTKRLEELSKDAK